MKHKDKVMVSESVLLSSSRVAKGLLKFKRNGLVFLAVMYSKVW